MEVKQIGTNDGSCHADEVMVCTLLKQHPDWRDAEIVRSGEQEVWDNSHIRVNVGLKYDHQRRRYDHHQRGFEKRNKV